MAYAVSFSSRAKHDLESLYYEVRAEYSEAAREWYLGLTEAILSLEEHPHRCSFTARERGLRHLLYGNKPHIYRVIFRIHMKQRRVEVLHIRHGARRQFTLVD